MNILMVDDNLELIEIFAELLRRAGNEDLAASAKRMGTPYWMTKPANLAGFLTILKRVRVENTAPAPRRKRFGCLR